MRRLLVFGVALLLLLPVKLLLQSPPHHEAARLLKQARDAWATGRAETAGALLARAAGEFDSLSRAAQLPADQQTRLRDAAAELRLLSRRAPSLAAPVSLAPYLDTLASASAFFTKLRTTYTEPAVVERTGGGHATAPGPPTVQRSSHDDLRELGASLEGLCDFRVAPAVLEKTFFGGAEKNSILESTGGGVALLDFDRDGLLDIYLVNGMQIAPGARRIPHRNALYRNLGGWKFENVARRAGVDAAAWGSGVCAGDYNGDGLLDLYVTNFGPNILFRNRGDGSFAEVAAEAGVAHPGWSTGCSFFDADADGNLDLYVANYISLAWEDVLLAKRTRLWRGGPHVMFGPAGLPAVPDVLYHNQGNGRFSDQTPSLQLPAVEPSYGLGVLTTDVDQDGWVDIYVANDSNPNFLFRNRGHGRFEEIGVASGAALNIDGRAQAGMGVDAGDFDGDGLLDIVVTNFAHDTNTLYRNLGNGLFEDVTLSSGLHARTFERLGWGAVFFDADRDGRLDLFFANGHIFPQVDRYPHLRESFRQKNQLFLNLEGRFRDISEGAGTGLQVAKSHRGLAAGDLDNDGDVDLVVTSMDDTVTLLENRSRSSHHWVAFRLESRGKNRFCIGARVVVDAGGRRQVREVRSGGSYLSQKDLRLHFGLGTHQGPVDVAVWMPGGRRYEWKAVGVDRLVTLTLEDSPRNNP